MKFGEDTRGQSVLIGSILLFAILIIAFSTYQAVVIPSQNAEVEFSHSQQIENEFSEFRSNIVNAIESSDERSTSFTLGTQYPSRLIALNPPPAAGTLSTTEPGEVSIDGVDIEEVCGTDDATSRSLVYEPQYNEYTSAQSTVYEHTFVGTTFRDGQSFPQPQRLIREDGVYLTLLNGSVSESRSGAAGVNINATHRSDPVEGVTNVTIPSQFDNETWENQILDGQGNVDNIENTPDGVKINFVDSVEVSCAVVGLNGPPAFSPPQEETPTESEPAGGNASLFDTRWTENDPVEVSPGESNVSVTMRAIERGTSARPIENATVDFANEGNTNLFDRWEPQGDVTNGTGEQVLEVDISDGASPGDQSRIYTTAGDDSDSTDVTVEEEEEEDPTVFYSDTGVANVGTLDEFNNMQADDGEVAGFISEGGEGSAFDIDITTNDVPEGDYTLEILVADGSYQGGGVTVEVDGETVATIEEDGLVSVNLEEIEGDITVNYQAGNQNSDISVDYQRLVANE